ncbi:MAG: hypothetical protein KGD64_10585 [Candidatus Heimdallarchaeota archaeon]|nr:hypothetical protein [Candidatus Heimdallarchaeota archaeon]
MNKGLKIFLIIFSIVVILGGTFGGTLFFSYKNVSYSVDDTTVAINITTDIFWDFTGFIVTRTPVEITNGGLYEFQDIVVIVEVYGSNFFISSLNGLLLSEGENSLGNIKPGTNWSGYIETNITKEIVILALQDGDLEIKIGISLSINFFVFKYNLAYNATQIIAWDSPFGI